MKFTDTERVILANQYEILGKLGDDQAYLDLAENLRYGHEWIYNQKSPLALYLLKKSQIL